MPKTVRGWLVFVVVQLLVILGLVEIGLRVARPHHEGLKILLYAPTVRTEYDEIETTEELLETNVLGFHPLEANEGFVRNSRGFRTPEYDPDPDPGVPRIVVLGDSFTYSSSFVPWSWMWPMEMERRLEDLTGGPVEVINLGVPAVGPRFELRLWELEGARLDPDWVILAFFVGNDFTDESGRELIPTREGFWVRHSLTFRLARNLLRLWRQRRAADAPWPEPPSSSRYERGGFELPGARAAYDPDDGWYDDEDAFLRLERDRLLLCARAHRERFESLFTDVAPVLIRLHRQVRASGAELAVLIIPDELQVDPDLLDRLLERFDIPRDQVDVDYPQERLADLFEAEGIPFYDALPALREETRERRLYKPMDTHWNAEGNLFVGRRMAKFLVSPMVGFAEPQH